ncbi:MAG TPA: hypothetical protein PKB10_04175 [Tepidisphaeraceae bacterium]|nr:hypothetical protein [Tepidisphaeraceae bacterium]
MNSILEKVRRVRSLLTLHGFIHALAWMVTIALVGVLLAMIVQRVSGYALPGRAIYWLTGAGAAAVIAAMALAIARRPSQLDAALGTRENLSTALFVGSSTDPFAIAAVNDAEQAARSLDTRRHFKLATPRGLPYALTTGVVALLTWAMLPQITWGQDEPADELAVVDPNQPNAVKQQIEALARAIDEAPDIAEQSEALQEAKRDLENLRALAERDPDAARREVQSVQRNIEQEVQRQIQENQAIARAREDQRQFQNNLDAPTKQGEVADAHRAVAKGDFQEAIASLQEAVDKFEQKDDEQKQETANQMQELARQLEQAANDPQQQKRMEEQLNRMGMNKEQAQQAMDALQRAAQGDPQAAEQLQQMAQNAMQQMNNGQGPTPEQQQQIENMLQQLQAQASSREQAEQLAQAAQKLAQAMQQACNNPGQGGNPQPGQGNQAGNAPGGNMGDALAGMQDALDQMDAIQRDAQQMQALAGACKGGGDGNNPGQGMGQGQWKAGDPKGQGAGMGGPGIGAGGEGQRAPAPFTSRAERSQSHDNPEGRVLARTFVRDGQIITGESKAGLRQTLQAEEERAAEEVDQQRISPEARRAQREYFKALESQ